MSQAQPLTPLSDTVAFLQSRFPQPVKIAVILGSGLGEAAETLAGPDAVKISYGEIPGFPPAKGHVVGHAGRLLFSTTAQGHSIAWMQGRFHGYQGYSLQEVTLPLRALHGLGAQTLIVTNAAGGIGSHLAAGDLMLITDHLNLMGANPLTGLVDQKGALPFVDMSEAYCPTLRTLAKTVAQAKDVNLNLKEGVYAGLPGPTYETPAEVRMLKTLGADAVGMSTVPEVIVARQLGLRVLGISCITNLAAGVSPTPLSHAEVLETGRQVKPQFARLLQGVLDQWTP